MMLHYLQVDANAIAYVKIPIFTKVSYSPCDQNILIQLGP